AQVAALPRVDGDGRSACHSCTTRRCVCPLATVHVVGRPCGRRPTSLLRRRARRCNGSLAWQVMTTQSRPVVLGATGAFMFNPLGWAMDVLADAGFRGVEVLFGQGVESRDSDKILGFAQAAGLSVPVVHGPYMLFLRNVFSANYAEKTRRSVE